MHARKSACITRCNTFQHCVMRDKAITWPTLGNHQKRHGLTTENEQMKTAPPTRTWLASMTQPISIVGCAPFSVFFRHPIKHCNDVSSVCASYLVTSSHLLSNGYGAIYVIVLWYKLIIVVNNSTAETFQRFPSFTVQWYFIMTYWFSIQIYREYYKSKQNKRCQSVKDITPVRLAV